MLTKREVGLNLFWLVALAIPAASAVYSCILNAESRTDYVLGLVSGVILFCALFYFVPRYNHLKPKQLFATSFPVFFAAYVPSTIGLWQDITDSRYLVHPIFLFLFIGCSGQLREWAAAPAATHD